MAAICSKTVSNSQRSSRHQVDQRPLGLFLGHLQPESIVSSIPLDRLTSSGQNRDAALLVASELKGRDIYVVPLSNPLTQHTRYFLAPIVARVSSRNKPLDRVSVRILVFWESYLILTQVWGSLLRHFVRLKHQKSVARWVSGENPNEGNGFAYLPSNTVAHIVCHPWSPGLTQITRQRVGPNEVCGQEICLLGQSWRTVFAMQNLLASFRLKDGKRRRQR